MASSTAAGDGLTPAQKLMAEHEAAHVHQPTVEDVPDEDDPQPTVAPPLARPANTSGAVNGTVPMSEKAAGKQRAPDVPAAPPVSKPAQQAPLDTSSEEAFPSLAPARPAAQTAPGFAWGNKPASVARAANGVAAVSGGAPAQRAPMSMPGHPSAQLGIPGRFSESYQIPSSQIKTKNELKKPVADLVKDMNKRSVAKVEVSTNTGMVNFRAQGPTQESVQQVLKDIVSQVAAKQSIKIPIPASTRPHIIGKQGANIQAISKRTGARIQIPKPVEGEDDDSMIDVVIEGDHLAAALARRDIDAIVNERTSTINTKLRHVPPELYPFIAGAHNTGINALEEGRNVNVTVPQFHTWHHAPPQDRPSYQPHPHQHIQVSGDREDVRQVQAEIERQATELQSILGLRQIPVERERHQFVLGPQGDSLHDFLEETGCSVILPPPDHDSEMVTIVGPLDQIENAENKIMDLASSMSMATVDVAKQHGNAHSTHARDLTRYLQQRQALRELEKLHEASIVTPSSADSSPLWQIYAREGKNSMRARAEVMNLLSGHPPSRFRNIPVDPFYQQEIRERHAQAVRDQYGVHVAFPEEADDSGVPVLLVYEGPGAVDQYVFPRARPSPTEIAQFEEALNQAEQYIQSISNSQGDITEASVEAPLKYREKIQRHANRENQRDIPDTLPLQFLGLHEALAPGHAGDVFPVNFRGPTATVDNYRTNLLAFIEQQIQEEAERGYTTSCDFPQQYTNQLIGRNGARINQIRDEYDVDLKVQDGKVEIQGPKAKADAARAHIVSMAKKLEDEATHVIKIRSEFHGDLIGQKGGQVNRLQDRYNVRIMFPRSGASPTETGSVVEGETAPVSKGGRRGNQSMDEVVIRGPRKGADEARDELLSLYQYLQDNSHTATVSIAGAQLPSLIGTRGRELESLRLATGAQIDVPGSRDETPADASGRVEVTIKGTKTQVDAAKKLLQQRAKTFDESIQRSIDVDKKHHRALIGPRGENLRDMIITAGGTGDDRERARLIKIPKADSDETAVRLEGQRELVEKLAAAIEQFVTLRENQITDSIEVPPERHGGLIGRGGETRRNLENEFKVQVSIPSTSVTGPERSLVKVSGSPENVELAKARIKQMTSTGVNGRGTSRGQDRPNSSGQSQHEETLQMPRRMHHAVADFNNNQIFRDLRDMRVVVDHAGQSRPAMPAHRNYTPQAKRMPLITDTSSDVGPADMDEHTWEMIAAVAAAEDEANDPTIPWVLRAQNPEGLAQAQEAVRLAMESAMTHQLGYLVLPDQRLYRHAIGPGGATINAIRDETGCSISVPAKDKGEAIRIEGPAVGVERAKEMILEAIVAGASSGGRRRG